MSADKKGRRGPPPTVVIRRPGAPTPAATPTPSVPEPRPVTPTAAPAPAAPRPAARPGGRPPRRSGPPRPPPSPEQVNELARRERVPARIAKGDLEGKMKCRIWRKLHAEEAKRFDEAYSLMEKTPGLSLPDAFGLLQSGLTLEAFQARRARAQKKDAVKQARSAVSGEAVAELLERFKAERAELAVVLGERTVLDVLTEVRPVALHLEKSGRVEKLQVVLVLRRVAWERLSGALERDARLAQKPAAVAREPERRPFSDPRVFLDQVGKPVRLVLRNGITLSAPLQVVGPFDLILAVDEHEVFVPIHAVVRWGPAGEPPSPEPA